MKPEVATHEGLFDLEQATKLPIRFAWVMLWTVCDREGRFRWRPRMLKADVLPFDELNFEQVLDALAGAGFIRRYEAKGEAFGYIPTWHDHQTLNSRESASKLPIPPALTAGAVKDQCMHAHARAEGERELEGEGEREGEGKRAPVPVVAMVPRLADPVAVVYTPAQLRGGVLDLVAAWNRQIADVPELRDREVGGHYDRQKVQRALETHPNLTWWDVEVIPRVCASRLLRGLEPWRNGDLKVADFWWVLRNADEIAAKAYDTSFRVPVLAPLAPTKADQRRARNAASSAAVLASYAAEKETVS